MSTPVQTHSEIADAVSELFDLHEEIGQSHPDRSTTNGFEAAEYDYINRILESIRLGGGMHDEDFTFSDADIVYDLFNDLDYFKEHEDDKDFLEVIESFENAYRDATPEVRKAFTDSMVEYVREAEAESKAKKARNE